MAYKEIMLELSDIGDYKIPDCTRIAKYYLKNNLSVEDLKGHLLENQALHHIYFEVELTRCKSMEEQFKLVEDHFDDLKDWYHTDELIHFIRKYIKFDYAYKKAIKYIKDKREFVRRWGYVLFLAGLQKKEEDCKKILKLIKNDDAYYVYMAEAWLLCDLAIFNPEIVYDYLVNCDLNYILLSKAISKINDSYRVSKEWKDKFKALREVKKGEL